MCVSSRGFECTLCYAETKEGRLYRVLQKRVTWEAQLGVRCNNLAVVPALVTAPSLQSPSFPPPSHTRPPSSSIHLLLDVSNPSDCSFDLSCILDGRASEEHHVRSRSDRRWVHGTFSAVRVT